MKAQITVYNEGQSGQYFGLVRFEESDDGKRVERCPLHYAPHWKTAKGAERYANKKGYELITA